MAKKLLHVIKTNRGRIQAQGTDGPKSNLEKSMSWASDNVPTKADGHSYVADLKAQLNVSQLEIRENAFRKVDLLIDRAPARGLEAQIINSYAACPPTGKNRVDVEIRAGMAFCDK